MSTDSSIYDSIPTSADDLVRCDETQDGCGKWKRESQFRTQGGNHSPLCTTCRRRIDNERLIAYRARNPEKTRQSVRKSNLWRNYKISPEEYDAMREAQEYRCAACGTHEDDIEVLPAGRPRGDGTRGMAFALQVDHCHRTNRIRGLLCSKCHRILGVARDNPATLEGCLAYLAADADKAASPH